MYVRDWFSFFSQSDCLQVIKFSIINPDVFLPDRFAIKLDKLTRLEV